MEKVIIPCEKNTRGHGVCTGRRSGVIVECIKTHGGMKAGELIEPCHGHLVAYILRPEWYRKYDGIVYSCDQHTSQLGWGMCVPEYSGIFFKDKSTGKLIEPCRKHVGLYDHPHYERLGEEGGKAAPGIRFDPQDCRVTTVMSCCPSCGSTDRAVRVPITRDDVYSYFGYCLDDYHGK